MNALYERSRTELITYVMVRQCGEKDWRICSNDNTEGGIWWTPKYRKPEADLE